MKENLSELRFQRLELVSPHIEASLDRRGSHSPHRGIDALRSLPGAGTTMIAAHRHGGACIGVEIDPKYVAVTLEGLKPRLVDGQKGDKQKDKKGK